MLPHVCEPLIGFKGRIDRKPYFLPEMPLATKIIFLNKTNLAELEGYKAEVQLHDGKFPYYEIHIFITGFKAKGAEDLYVKLKALPKNEVYSNKQDINCSEFGE